MPFTAAHPAIVLPLAWLPPRWISITGLVIGSMTPDFEYFFRMKLESEYSHTLLGLLWLNLPVSLLLAFLYHQWVRDPMISSLPNFFQRRLARYQKFNWREHFRANWYIVLLSLLIGAGSHILWDSFTHEHTYFVQNIPFLRSTLNLAGFSIPVYKILQHGGTLLGFAFMALVFLRLPPSPTAQGNFVIRYWLAWACIALLLFSLRFLIFLDMQMYSEIIASGIATALLALVIVSRLPASTFLPRTE